MHAYVSDVRELKEWSLHGAVKQQSVWDGKYKEHKEVRKHRDSDVELKHDVLRKFE